MEENSTPDNIFSQLEAMGKKTHRIGVTLIDREKIDYDEISGDATNLKELTKDSPVVYFNITPVTLDIEEKASVITNEVTPPPLFEEHPTKPLGTIKKLVGYNTEDPNYRADLEKAARKREMFICLSCCEELFNSIPGSNMEEKINTGMTKIPRAVITGLFTGIANIGGVVNDASFFLNSGSKDSPSSKSSES